MDQHTVPCIKTYSVYSALTYKTHLITLYVITLSDTNPTRQNPIPGDVDRKPNHSFENYVKAKMCYHNAGLYIRFFLGNLRCIEADDVG